MEYLKTFDTRKILASLTAIGCGVYLSKEFYTMWQERHRLSAEWLNNNGFVRHPAYDSYPDLSVHNNLMATYLTPEIYDTLKHKKTAGEFTLEKVIQVGVDCPGKPWERASGVIAGDQESYEIFSLLFDKIIQDLHNHGPYDSHKRDFDTQHVDRGNFDGKYVKSIRLSVLRSLKGYRLPAACSRKERREMEHAVRLALCRLQDELKGEYFAVADLSEDYKRRLSSKMLLPDSTVPVVACSGRARDWPDARGIFMSNGKSFVVIVNETEHLQIVCLSKDSHLLATFKKFCRGINLIEEEFRRDGEEFAWSNHLGYIVSDPVHLGTGLDMKVRVRLRRLSMDNRLHFILKSLNLKRSRKGILSVNIPKGEFYVYIVNTLGVTEGPRKLNSHYFVSILEEYIRISQIEMLQVLIDGVHTLIQLEIMLEKREDIDDVISPRQDGGQKYVNCIAADILTRS